MTLANLFPPSFSPFFLLFIYFLPSLAWHWGLRVQCLSLKRAQLGGGKLELSVIPAQMEAVSCSSLWCQRSDTQVLLDKGGLKVSQRLYLLRTAGY